MKVRKTVPLAVLSLVTPVLGCGKILDIEEKHYVQRATGNLGGTSGQSGSATGGSGGANSSATSGGEGGAAGSNSSAPAETCALLSQKTAKLRIMNAIAGSPSLDVCVRATGNSSYGEPWFRNGGAACGNGVPYSKYTTDLGIDAGTYDFKLVASQARCNDSGVEVLGVTLAENTSVSLVATGVDLEHGKVSTHKNRAPSGLDVPIRFIHAANVSGPATVGLAKESSLPTTMGTPMFVDVEPGGVAKPSAGGPTPIDNVVEDGYILFAANESVRMTLSIGAALGGSSSVSMVVPLTVAAGHAYSVFTLGTEGSVPYKPKLWTCDDTLSDGLFLNCGNPVNVAFEVFNANLADAFTPFVTERTLPATRAIQSEEADVLCVAEIYDPSIRELLKPNSGKYKAVVFADEIPENRRKPMPLRQDGEPCQYPPVSCPDGISSLLDAFLTCGMNATETSGASCTTLDSNSEHKLAHPGETALGCFATNCLNDGLALTNADESGIGALCYLCGLTHLASYDSFEDTLTACSTPSEKPEHFAFGGATGLVTFSRYPLAGEPELHILPSTSWVRAVMRVPVQLPNGTVVDHWCGNLRYPNAQDALPYVGQYGEGNFGNDGIIPEQRYQIQTLIAAAKEQRNTSGNRAVLGIVSYTGPELRDANNNVLVYGQAPENHKLLEDAWPRLVAKDYTPQCTYCSDPSVNALNTGASNLSAWTTHLFGDGLTSDDVVSTTRTFTEQQTTLSLASGTLRAPVSQHFGLRSVVRITE